MHIVALRREPLTCCHNYLLHTIGGIQRVINYLSDLQRHGFLHLTGCTQVFYRLQGYVSNEENRIGPLWGDFAPSDKGTMTWRGSLTAAPPLLI
jgi:hypothetical protein